MSSSRERRVAKELQDIKADWDKSGIMVELFNESDLTHLKGIFAGPPDSPYEGGTYVVDIKIPDNYPFKAPQIKFITKIWHPNVSSVTGAICLDTLGSGWSPVGTIKTTLISLRMLLESPNPKDPQDAEVARMMNTDPVGFTIKAHEWAVREANAPRRELPTGHMQEVSKPAVPRDDPQRYKGYSKALVERFVNMGFDVDAVVSAFLFVGIDKNGGQDYELEEAYMGDITARLLGES